MFKRAEQALAHLHCLMGQMSSGVGVSFHSENILIILFWGAFQGLPHSQRIEEKGFSQKRSGFLRHIHFKQKKT